MKTYKSCFTLLAAALLLGSCKKELLPGQYIGQSVSMGNGKVWSWVKFDKEGNPQAMGFSFTDAALQNLPDSTSHPSGNDHANIFAMEYPPTAVTKTPFQHCAINWNPKGHTSPVYDKPHLDMHFYLMSTAERKKIPHYPEQKERFENYPDAAYLPPRYIVPGPPGGGAVAAAEPEMGTHWVDSLSPEMKGSPFTETFVYGTWDGKVNFYEPMITYSMLKNISTFTRSIPQPAKVQQSGYYPRKLKITHAKGEYEIALEDFYYRAAQ